MAMDALRQFFKLESAGGILLVIAAALAMIAANSSVADLYQAFLAIRMEVRIADLEIAKPLILWINDGLMAVFFFLVGLEIKREFMEGELASRTRAALPAVGAVGGMIVPALIYAAINLAHDEKLYGWAIPAATDIAFALGVLALLGKRVPLALKVLLTAMAILDDLGAIVIIAVFYTEDLSLSSLAFSGVVLAVLAAFNLFGVRRLTVYIVLGVVLWVLVLKSGVHATLAGVALAMTIPIAPGKSGGPSPLKTLEHDLHSVVAYGVLPLFAFANAGVSFAGIGLYSLVEPVALGIALGLFVGKQLGIFAALKLAIRVGIAEMPAGCSWASLYGMSLLCGIGFTMSLFIGGLAWPHDHFYANVRLGVLSGSVVSAVVGLLVLTTVLPKAAVVEMAEPSDVDAH